MVLAEHADEREPHKAQMPKSPARALEPEPAPAKPVSGKGEPKMAPRPARIRISSFLNFLGALIMLAVLAGAAGLIYANARFEEQGPLTRPVKLQIKPGMGLSAIAQILKKNGVIENIYIFRGGAVLHEAAGKLKAGEYVFEPGISMREAMQKMEAGQSVLHRVTIPEGLTTRQILERIRDNPVLIGEMPEDPGEGRLLPETYSFTRGLDRKTFVKSMQDAQTRLLDRLWPNRQANLPFKTREEAIILASIVEKETGKVAERPHIAGVFINRLNKGMRLQSDPTIIYGLVRGKGSLGRPIRVSDLISKTAYNTYIIKGLPPGPIANPGEAAIRAVLQPMATKDLYFVADGTGGHAFAATLKAHNLNVAKWRKLVRARRAAKKSPVVIKTSPLNMPAPTQNAPTPTADTPTPTGKAKTPVENVKEKP